MCWNNKVSPTKWEGKNYYDFGNNDEQEGFVEEILAHKWTNNNLELQVKWTLGNITWEPISSCSTRVLSRAKGSKMSL